MVYMLDTNAVSDILRKKYNVGQHLDAELDLGNEIAICPIVHYKIIRGLKTVNSKNKMAEYLSIYNNDRILKLPLDYAAMEKAAEIYVALHRGQQIEDNDIYIAAAALVNGCTLVTANDKHFSRIDDLNVENWR